MLSRTVAAAAFSGILLFGSLAPAAADDAIPPSTTTQSGPTAEEISSLRHDMEILQRRLDQLTGGTAAERSAPAVQRTQQQGETIVRRPAADRSVDDIYQSQNALFARRLTITPSITQAYSDNRYFTLNGFLALGAIFLGNANVAQERSNVTIFNLNANYGVNDRLQLEANIPYYSRDTSFSSIGANTSTDVASEARTGFMNMGDISLGAFYKLHAETQNTPSVVVNGHVSLPTGRAPYGIKLIRDRENSNLTYPAKLPTGSGAFGYEGGVSFVKTLDPAILFGGVNYYMHTPTRFADLGNQPDSPATPGVVHPGNAYVYTFGTAFALNERTSLSFSFQDTLTDNTRIRPDGQPLQSIIGSGTNAAVFNIGSSYSMNNRQSVVTEVGIGLTRDAPNFQFGVRFPRKF